MLIETTFGVLKENFHLDHFRHRSPADFVVNLLGTLITYCLKEKKAFCINQKEGTETPKCVIKTQSWG